MTENVEQSHLILLSGARGVGKTTLLKQLLELLRQDEIDIAGILSLPVEQAGEKVAIEGIDLRSGETRRLAIRNQGTSGQWITRQWQFDQGAMLWANHLLENSTPCDLLVIDELGVLEFERNQGWLAGLKAIDDSHYRAAILVIRPELLEKARKRWSDARVINITPGNRSACLDTLKNLIML